MNNKYVVGLNIGNHDSAAALIKDGEVISYIEQERVSRNKMAIGEAPIDALLACLNKEGITLKEVEAIGVGMDWKYRNSVYQMDEQEHAKYVIFEDPDWYLPKEIFGDYRPPIHVVRHHLAHASSAYRISGFDECAILVIDNRGEDASTSLGYAKDGEIKFFKQINIQNSLGIYYNRACKYTGLYGKYREVGKFMGLACYGKPILKTPLTISRDGQLFKSLPNIENATIYDSIGLRTEQFAEYFKKNCFPYESGNVKEIMSYANFAASIQKSLEDALIDFVKELKEKTNSNNLVISGGIALNCSANGKIEEAGIFENLYVPPFASDSGTAVGSALEVYHELFGKPHTDRPIHYAGMGLSYTNESVIKTLETYDGLEWEIMDEDHLYNYVSSRIADGEIISWCQGGFEAGPRALGNRSILADPRTRKSLIKLNEIKEREMWRPIAPSVLIDDYSIYFEGNPESRHFMNVATLVKKDVQHLVPAITHVDETARPQVVTKENERYYKLISSFKDKTGVSILCNTSFNQRGVPLVNTPKDAIECFVERDIDMLVFENVVVRKRK